MKYSLLLLAFIGTTSLWSAPQPMLLASAEPTETVSSDMQSANTPTSTINVTCPSCKDTLHDENIQKTPKQAFDDEKVLEKNKNLLISVVGQGVAPMNTSSPAQAYALAKRAAVADAYRLIAEKVKGVRIDGQDLIKNMMVKRSTVRTSVTAMVRNANIVETTFKEGLCEVEMEIVISHDQFQ